MNADLLRRADLEVPGDVRGTIEKWRAATDPRFRDFGFVAIHGMKGKADIAGWATVDFVANGTGDIGFFAREAFRRYGLARVTVAAALEHGLTHGLSWINWTCDEENHSSIRTAQRLGLQREQDYVLYYFLLNEEAQDEGKGSAVPDTGKPNLDHTLVGSQPSPLCHTVKLPGGN